MGNYFMHGTIIPCVLCVLATNGEIILSDERTDNLKRFWGVPCEERTAALTYAVPFSVQGNFVQTMLYAEFEDPRLNPGRRPKGKCFTTFKPTVRAIQVIVSTPRYIQQQLNMQYVYHDPQSPSADFARTLERLREVKHHELFIAIGDTFLEEVDGIYDLLAQISSGQP